MNSSVKHTFMGSYTAGWQNRVDYLKKRSFFSSCRYSPILFSPLAVFSK
jgi:hypothetical protein